VTVSRKYNILLCYSISIRERRCDHTLVLLYTLLETMPHIVGWGRGLALCVRATESNHLARCWKHNHLRYLYGFVAMRVLLIFTTDSSWFVTYSNNIDTNFRYCGNKKLSEHYSSFPK
jgi:hypothetical protein